MVMTKITNKVELEHSRSMGQYKKIKYMNYTRIIKILNKTIKNSFAKVIEVYVFNWNRIPFHYFPHSSLPPVPWSFRSQHLFIALLHSQAYSLSCFDYYCYVYVCAYVCVCLNTQNLLSIYLLVMYIWFQSWSLCIAWRVEGLNPGRG